MGSLLNSYLICVSKIILGLVNRSLTWITKIVIKLISSLQTQTLDEGGRMTTLKEATHWTANNLSFFFSLPPKRPMATVNWGKGNEISQGLLDTCLELMLIPRDPKCRYHPSIRTGAFGGQVINRFSSDQSHTGLSRSSTHPTPSSRLHHWNRPT